MIVPNGTVVMVLDGAKMALYRNVGEAFAPELELLESVEEEIPSSAELGSDRPGRHFESMGTSRGAYEAPDYHQEEEARFAREAAGRLNLLAADEHVRLILIADPRILGLVRPQLDEATVERLAAQIDRNYAGRSARDVGELLAGYEA